MQCLKEREEDMKAAQASLEESQSGLGNPRARLAICRAQLKELEARKGMEAPQC